MLRKHKKPDEYRDKEITRQIHKLFWDANFDSKMTLALTYLLRVPALIFYHILIPISVALGVQAIFKQDFERVTLYAVAALVLAILYAVFWGVGGVAVMKNGANGGEYVQRRVFENYLRKDYEFYANSYTGALGAQATQLREAYNQYSQMVTLHIPTQAVIVIVGVAVISFQSLLLASVTVVTMAAILSFTIWFSRHRLLLRRKVGEASSDLAGEITDALSHGATVKSFANETHELSQLTPVLQRWRHAQYRSWLASIPADGVRTIMAALATGVLLIMTAKLYKNHAITLAIVALVQLYVIKLVAATETIANLIRDYEQVMGIAYRSVKTMMVPTTIVDTKDARALTKRAAPTVELKDVDFRYADADERTLAVRKFNLPVSAGEKIGIVGYSGSGKSTLTKLLMRFVDVTGGSIKIGGIDIRDVKQDSLRRFIAYVPQEPLLFHRTIRQNIAYGKPNAKESQVLDAAKAAYVDEFVVELPKGYDTYVGERGVKLSGGQRQRVAIARAILKDAPILVLDEATSALDSRSERLIQGALWRLMKKRTAIVIAHRLSTIQRMDRIVVMDQGKVVQIGTHQELLADTNGIYAKLWAHQSDGYIGADVSSSKK